MRPDRVFLSGSSSIPHSVTDRLLAGLVQPRNAGDAGNLKDYRLVIVDARLANDDLADDGLAQRALEAGVSVLILAPSEGQLQPLSKILGAVSHSAEQAVFITPATNAEGRYEVRTLGYPGSSGFEVDGKKKAEQPARPKRVAPAQGSPTLSRYISHIESRLERGYEFKSRVTFPDGLKWFYTPWGTDRAFGFHTEGEYPFDNGEGTFSFDYEIWALLSQSATSEMTYIVTEGTCTVYPGTLAQNDDEGRCIMNLKTESGLKPETAEISAVDHIPVSGIDSWSDSFSVEVSYLTPFGAYAIYSFEASVSQSIASWSVQNRSNGAQLGSVWFVNTPVNGFTMPEDKTDAFNGSGHVEPFPVACMETLSVKDASAWRVPGKREGLLHFVNDGWTTGWSLYGTACGLAFCYDPDADSNWWHFYPSFDINIAFS